MTNFETWSVGHAVHQKYTKLFGNGEVFKAEHETIRGWLNYIAYRVEDATEQKQSFIALMGWVTQNVDTSALPCVPVLRACLSSSEKLGICPTSARAWVCATLDASQPQSRSLPVRSAC